MELDPPTCRKNKLIADNQPAPKVSNRPEWYAKKLKGFTQDGKLMIFFYQVTSWNV